MSFILERTYLRIALFFSEINRLGQYDNPDLIICDESHWIPKTLRKVLDYYNCWVIGLTATPREEIDRSTYSLLQLDEGNPNYAYEYANAVRDGHLVSYRAFCRSSKIMSEGIKYSDLSEAEKQQLEEVWEYERAKQ